MAGLDNELSETSSKPREQSHIPLDLMTTISRGARYNTADAKDKSLRRTTSAQIPLDLIKTLSRSTTRDAANRADIERQLDLEAADHSHDISGRTSPTLTGDDAGSGDTDNDDSPSKNVLHFSHNDPTNPYCFSTLRKTVIVLTGMLIVVNSAMGSSVASGITSEMTDYFGITSKSQLVLPTSIYIVGYVLGPLVFSPLSETFGRKIVMISTFVVYTAFTLGCALAPTWAGLIVMRLLAGIGASTPNSVVGGIYADIFSTPRERGRVIALYMAFTTWGPLIGPIASGFLIGVVSWRWAYWLMLILAGVTWPPLLLMPETYGPVVLKKKAQAMRKQGQTILAPIELDPPDVYQMVVVILTRPVRMFLFESIVLFSCLYTALIYAIFYSRFPTIHHGTKRLTDNAFSVPPSLPHHLHRRLRFQCRRARPRLPRDRHRQCNRLRHLSGLGLLPCTRRRPTDAAAMVPPRRIPPGPSSLPSRSPPRHKHVLAGLDSQTDNPLDRAHGGRDPFRHCVSPDIHGAVELHRRCV
jgi:multidrug resistance protein